MLFMQAAWDSQAHWLSGLGSCGNAVCMSAEMMLVQLAWLRAAQFLRRGLAAPTAADCRSLTERGPGAQFLEDDLTLANLRSGEFFADPLFAVGGRPEGSVPLLERAHAHVEELSGRAASPSTETPICLRKA